MDVVSFWCKPRGLRHDDPSSVAISMLTIRDLKMSMGGRTLFENASFQVNYGDRVALVGPNGAGKSTLFSIILKKNVPDEGAVERDEWTMVGYLPQEGEAVGDETVLEVATGRASELPRLEQRRQAGTHVALGRCSRGHCFGNRI